MEPAALSHVAVNLEAIVDLTCELIACDSTNPGSTEASTVAVLVDFARRAGLLVHVDEVVPGRPNVVITLPASSEGEAAPGLLFLGHSDVVPAGEAWTADPFVPRIEDGRIIGRGSTDMKGGLAVILTVMAALAESRADWRVNLTGPVSVAVTVDEEETGIGIRQLVEAGSDGRIVGLGPHAGTAFHGCVVAEPTDLEVVRGCRGDSYIDVEITGRPAHSGRPEDGVNAISAAAEVLAEIERDNRRPADTPDPVLGAATWSPGLISGGIGTSIVAADCTLSVDRRLLPGESARVIADELTARLRDVVPPGIEVSSTVTMSMPGFITDEEDPLVQAAARTVGSALGRPAMINSWSASCDGGFIAETFGMPVIVCGPGGINDQAHQADESVGVDELAAAARAFTDLILTSVGGDSS